MRALIVIILASLFISPHVLSAKKPRSSLRIVVLDHEGEPVPRASLIICTLKGKKHKKIGRSFELRTSQQGTAPLPPIKQGFVLLQVIAEGYQTYGETVELREPEQTVTVKLKRPQDQFSVHK